MSKTHIIRRGLNLPIVGEPSQKLDLTEFVRSFALSPSDYINLNPKLIVKVGDKVRAGDCIFHDKSNDNIRVTSPISGEISAIERGPKRRLDRIVIRSDEKCEYVDFGKEFSADKESTQNKLLLSGAWTLIQMRPYGCIANPNDTPKAIFVNGMNSSPLAPKTSISLKGREEDFATGLIVLKGLSPRTILSIDVDEESKTLIEAENVEVHKFSGPHPSGNTSVHIAKISPINKGDVVWTLGAQDVAIIGHLFNSGELHLDKCISAAGSGMMEPRYVNVRAGQSLTEFFKKNAKPGNYRFISGSVLTGAKVEREGYLSAYANQITIIPEGENTDFLGWVLPGFAKYSMSRAYFSWLFPKRKYNLTTKVHGEERAFVVTGQYDKVFPFDIFPNQLLKSIWANDLEKMEELGIYEIVPEDFALCEVICTSKQPLQEMVRKGLDVLYAEMN